MKQYQQEINQSEVVAKYPENTLAVLLSGGLDSAILLGEEAK